MANNWRYTPRTGVYNGVSITDEAQTIGFDTEANAYGFRLNETPQQDSPTSISMSAASTGAITYTEIFPRTAPSAGQFWVDYDADTFTGTGFIECNSSDSGTDVLISYTGRGSTITQENTAVTLTGAQTITGAKTFEADIDLTSGAQLLSDGTPCAGFLVDGTPYAIKEVSITLNSGSLSNTVSHGLTNAGSNDLVFDVRSRYDNGGNFILGGEGADGVSISDSTNMSMWGIGETNLTFYRNGSVTTTTFLVSIWYKLV
jgi:hypothetical protein